MIDVRELRIGNWVSVGKLGNVQIDGIQPSWIWFKETNSCGISVVKPITLTPEVLESVLHGLDTNGFELVWTRTKRLEVHMQGSYLTTVDYLHQYQNLYYSLTGQELEIKL